MPNFKHIVFIVLWGLVFGACEEEQEEILSEQPLMVVEGFIDSGGFPVVMLTTSVPISEESVQFDSLASHLLRWAKVSINDGEQTVILTGMLDRDYFPPFIYTTSRMRGKVGKTYTLEVEYQDYHATAVTTIPEPPQVDSFSVRPTKGESQCEIVAHISHKGDEERYYKAFVRMGRWGKQWDSAYLGLIAGDAIQENAELAVNRPWLITDNEEYKPSFNYADTLSVKIACLDAEAYRFWKDYEDHLNFSRNPLFPLTRNLHSNIQGGIGCWYGCGASIHPFALSDYK